MARRPKLITLEAVSDTTHKDHKRHTEHLMIDLLRKYPRGANCKLTLSDYRSHYSGHPQLVEREEVRSQGSHEENCGYHDLLIYRWCCALNIDASEWDWRHVVRKYWPELGKNGVTRRSRRLSARTEGAYRRIMRAGRPGIYSVNFGHGYNSRNNEMKVYAENSEMAVMTAKINLGATFENKDEANATFEREGCPSELMGLNHSRCAQFERAAAQKKTQIESLKREIELLELRSVMLKTYSIAAVAG